jgi:hypothetical protein
LIDKNIYSDGSIYQAKYSTRWVGVGNSVYAHDSKGYAVWDGSELAKPRTILNAYCVANSGKLDPASIPSGSGEVLIPGTSTRNSQKYLGTFVCKSGDSRLWAVDLSLRGPAMHTGTKKMPIGSDYEYYSVEMLVKEVKEVNEVNKVRKAYWIQEGPCQSRKLEEIRREAEALSKKIMISVDKVIDKSGFYTRETIHVSTHAKIVGGDCPTDLANVSFRVTPESGTPGYLIDFKPAEFIVTVSEVSNRDQVKLQSTVLVKAKKFHRISPNITFKNPDLAIHLTEFFYDDNARLTNTWLTLENRSGHYMTISAISIHDGQRIVTKYDMNLELPPTSVTSVNFLGKRLDSVGSVLDTYWAKGDIVRAKFDIGLSVKYKTTGGIERTFFEKKQIRLADSVSK